LSDYLDPNLIEPVRFEILLLMQEYELNISNLISAMILSFCAETTPDPQDLRSLAKRKGILPLYLDWSGAFAITRSGDIVSFLYDEPETLRPESDPRIRNMILFRGSKKFSELKILVPTRPRTASTCDHCAGTGNAPEDAQIGPDVIVCYCGGLGWIP
jgi:hypothetical protein